MQMRRPINYIGVLSWLRSSMGKLKAVAELFEGRHFDREVIILCVRWYLRRRFSVQRPALSRRHARWGRPYFQQFFGAMPPKPASMAPSPCLNLAASSTWSLRRHRARCAPRAAIDEQI